MSGIIPKRNQSESRLKITYINRRKKSRTNSVSFKTAADLFLAINMDLQYSGVASKVVPILGDLFVDQISLQDLDQYVEDRRNFADDKTIANELQFVALVFKLGMGKV